MQMARRIHRCSLSDFYKLRSPIWKIMADDEEEVGEEENANNLGVRISM
jgi:hypothetical protein